MVKFSWSRHCLCGCRWFDITLGEQHQSKFAPWAVYIVVQDVRLNPMSSVTDRGWWSMHSIIFAVISLAFLLSGVYSSCFFRMSVMDGWVRVALLVTVAFFAVSSFSYSPYDSRWLVLKCRMRFIVLNVLDNAPPREIYLEHKRQIANFSLFSKSQSNSTRAMMIWLRHQNIYVPTHRVRPHALTSSIVIGS